MLTILTIVSVVLFIFGSPIFLVIGIWVLGSTLTQGVPLSNLGSSSFEALNSYALLAAPLFILTGDFIAAGGIAKRMTEFARALLGSVRGGLAMSTIGACGMFAAISGSNSATTATIGSITYPAMRDNGYDKFFSAATSAAGGTVGIIIPPSVLFIVYGYLTNLPISELFLTGVVPGMMMVVAMMVTCYVVCRRRSYGLVEKFDRNRLFKAFPGASIGLAAIVIVLWGIYNGVFSPTEASAVTAVYCMFCGMVITRELKIKNLPKVIFRSSIICGILMPMVAISIMMQEMLAILGVRELITELLSQVGGYYTVLFIMMGIVLAAGTVLESVPNTIILAPILAPIAATTGINPFHFAVIFLIGDAIGFITPPYGLNLYVASGITGLPYFGVVKHVWPFLLALLIVWVVVALFPWLSIYLLKFAGLGGGGLTM